MSQTNHKGGRKKGTKVKIRPHDTHEADLAETSRLSRMGFSISEIVTHFDGRVSIDAVTKDLKTIRQRHLDSMIEDRRVKALQALEGIRDVRRMAYLAWMRSQQDAERVIDKSKTTDGSSSSEQTHIRTGQTGNAEFLRILFDTWERECKLLGLDEAIKVDLSTDGNRINWYAMTEPTKYMEEEDPLEKIIREEQEKGRIVAEAATKHDRIGFSNLVKDEEEDDGDVDTTGNG
jgi:hypothetical protein